MKLRQKLRDLEVQTNDLIDQNMEAWFNEIVIPEAKRFATAMFLPQDFIEAIEFRKTGKNSGRVVNNFGGPDVPLAVWFNYGTKRNYDIRPKVEHPEGSVRAARDREDVGEGHVQHPTMLHWIDEYGQEHFAKVVVHPGFPQTLAMQFGVEQGKKRLISKLPQLIEGARNESD